MSPAGFTYGFIPRSTIETLPTTMGIQVPGTDVLPNTVNLSAIATGEDASIASKDWTGYAYAAKWSPNGVANQFYSQPLSMGDDGRGWLEMEAVLVRLNTTYAPNGQFGVLGGPAADGTHIG